jgi:hypothetical protein
VKSRRAEHDGAAAKPAIVVDHAEAGNEPVPGLGDAGAERLSRKLPDGFDYAE